MDVRTAGQSSTADLTIVLPTVNERENVDRLIPDLIRVTAELGIIAEILVVDGGSGDGTAEAAERLGARVLRGGAGYGMALRTGFAEAKGRYVVTMDADLSHEASGVADLWAIRDQARIGIASRYVPGGSTSASRTHRLLSWTLNMAFSRGLSLPVRDFTNGYRIYPANAFGTLGPSGTEFDILPEIMVRANAAGWRLVEIPCRFAARKSGRSKRRYLRFAVAYVRTFIRMWRLRRSIDIGRVGDDREVGREVR